jgi:phage recombination protein Bet
MATSSNDTAPAKKGKAEIAKLITFDEEQIQLMKDTVARGATDNEFKLFMHLAQSYGLDPFAKEIWCIKYVPQGRDPRDFPATIFSSRDGYLKIASRDPQMDGIQSDAVCAADVLEKLSDGTVRHLYGNPRGTVIGAYALVFRKDRSRPAYFYAPFSEYNSTKNPTWAKYPTAMIVKVAEAMALKRAFSISGLVTQEELGLDAPLEQEPETSAVVVEEPTQKKSEAAASAPASTAPALSTGAAASGETMAEQLEAVLAQIESELQSQHITRIERGKMKAGLHKLTLKTAPASLAKLRQTCEDRIHPDALPKARLALRAFANANAAALGEEEYKRLNLVAGGLTVVAADLIGEMQDAEEWLQNNQSQAA